MDAAPEDTVEPASTGISDRKRRVRVRWWRQGDRKELVALVRALGGQTEVAEYLGVNLSTVASWYQRGIVPAEHQISVWRMSLERGIDWTPPAGIGLTLVRRDWPLLPAWPLRPVKVGECA